MRTLLLGCLALSLAASIAAADNPFSVKGKKPDKAIVHVALQGDQKPPAEPLGDSPMLKRLAGIAGELDKAQLRHLWDSADNLDGSVGGNTGPEDRHWALWGIRLTAGKDEDGTVVYASTNRNVLVATTNDQPGPEVRDAGAKVQSLKPEQLARALAGVSLYTGTFDPPKERLGEVVEMEKPYVPGWRYITSDELSQRLNGGRATVLKTTTRELAKSTFYARLPKNYSPKSPAGLLVWVDASPSGRPPSHYNQTADELNLILVGAADSDNDRQRADRLQLAMDIAATAQTRFHIDPRRVYATGVSGGSKMAGELWLGWPDVFAGAVTIVGLEVYENIPVPPRGHVPAGFARPKPEFVKTLKTRRMAAITGSEDFNRTYVLASVKIYQRDGLDVKLWDLPGMGHSMPPEPPRSTALGDAIRWIDEPYQKIRQAEIDAAQKLLDETLAANADPAAPKAVKSCKEALVQVTKLGPWTPAAWKAVERLNAARQ